MVRIRLGLILENACRLAGRDPQTMGIPAGWGVLAAMTVAEGLRKLSAEKFPLLQRIEYRRYRPEYSQSVMYATGHEVWHNGDYWRLENHLQAGEPGTAGGEGWRMLQASEVAAFISFNQPWEATVIDPAGVDVTRFAYAEDPKYHPEATPLKVATMNWLGVVLEAGAPDGVYCRFVPEPGAISFIEWTEGSSYSIGEAVYRAQTRDVYRLIAEPEDATVAPEDDSAAWVPVRVFEAFAPYLTRLVAADLLTEDQGKYQTRAAAETELEYLRERYHDGTGETRMRRGRFI